VCNVQYVFCYTAERAAVSAAVEEEGVYSGMLIRKHQWESTTKKASNRFVIHTWIKHSVKVVSDVVEKTSTRRRSRIPCVVVEKITTRRREGVDVVVEKMKVDELSTKIRAIYLQQ